MHLFWIGACIDARRRPHSGSSKTAKRVDVVNVKVSKEEENIILYYSLYVLLTKLRVASCFSCMFLVCPMKHATVLMTTDGKHQQVPLDEEVSPSVFEPGIEKGETHVSPSWKRWDICLTKLRQVSWSWNTCLTKLKRWETCLTKLKKVIKH